MLFIFIYFFCVIWFLSFSRYKRSLTGDFLCFFLVILLLWFIPAAQFGVGTDYFNYIDIYESSTLLSYYHRKDEYAFYYLVTLLKYLKLSPQSLFVSIGLLQVVLLCNFIRVAYKECSYLNLALIFTFIFFVTNIVHNQLNVLRAYMAVLLFINSFVYFNNRRFVNSLGFFILGLLWHKSIIFVAPLYLVAGGLGKELVKRPILIFTITFVVFGSGVLYKFVDTIVEIFAPMYKHYLSSDREKNVGIIQLATRLYYYPFYVVFLYYLSKFDINKFKKIDISLIAIWLVTINSALFVFYFGRFSRIFYFFSPFMFVPFYYLYFMGRVKMVVLALIYTFFGYALKVLVFPSAEYLYESYIFN